MTELKNRFTRKGGSRVAEIHASLRSTTLETSTDIHDFAAKLRTFNDELAAIHDDYALRKWEMNLHFVDNLTDAYDSFTTGLLTSDNDFIEIGKEMDWHTLVNKAAEVESKAKSRGARTASYKGSLESRISRPEDANVKTLAAETSTEKYKATKKAYLQARKELWCILCEKPGHCADECYTKGKAPVPDFIKKKREAQEKKRMELKKAKDDKDKTAANYANDNDETVYACMAEVDKNENHIKVPKAPICKGYHHYIDSGAGRHLSGHQQSFVSFQNLDRPITVSGFAGAQVVTRKGTMKINISVYGTPKVLIIRDVLFLPGLRFSLLSVKAFGRKGLRSTFDETECEIVRKDSNSMVAVGVSLADFDLYRLTLSEETPIGTYFDAYHAAIKSSTPASTDNESERRVSHSPTGALIP